MESNTEVKTNAPFTKTAEKFLVRLPGGMRNKLYQAAKHSHRSMNSEIIARLDHSLTRNPPLSKAADHLISLSADTSQQPSVKPTKLQLDAALLQEINKLSLSKKQALFEILLAIK